MKTFNIFSSEENKNHFLIPDSAGRGMIQAMEVKSGLYLFLENYSLDESSRFVYQSYELYNPRVTGIGFCLSGYGTSQPQCMKKPFRIASGECNFFSFPSGIEYCETIKSKRMLCLTILITSDFMVSCLKDFPELLPKNFSLLLDGVHHNSITISRKIQNLINQILSCPFTGISRKFFIEAKVMEILAHFVTANAYKYPKSRIDGIKTEDIQKVQKAAEIMKFSKENFKNFESLARKVGMCRSRLHTYFRLVYGVPPWEYMRNFRMETAKSLIVNGEMSIAEIANYVGYSNLSNFTKTFREYEGVVPRAYKKFFENQVMNTCVI